MVKRWVLGIVLTLLALVAFFLLGVWWYVSRHPDIPPPEVSDLYPQRQPVPDAENAHPLLMEAAGLHVEDDSGLAVAYWNEDEVDPELLQQWLEANRPAFEAVHQAVQRTGYYYEQEYSFDALVPEVTGWLGLAQCMRIQAEEYRKQGRMEEAVQLVCDLNRFGMLIGEDGAVIISHLVGIAIAELGHDQTRRLVRDSSLTSMHVDALQQSLLPGERFLHGTEEALRGEFMTIKNLVETLANGPDGLQGIGGVSGGMDLDSFMSTPLVSGYVFQPNRTVDLAAEHLRGALESLEQPGKEESSRPYSIEVWLSQSNAAKIRQPNPLGMTVLALVLPATKNFSRRAVQIAVSRDATRLLLALKRYEFDHGALPERLEDLVPENLEQIPMDLFSGLPFRYDRSRAAVWSVGKDRVGQGGSVVQVEGRSKVQESDCEDQVYFLRQSLEEMQEGLGE